MYNKNQHQPIAKDPQRNLQPKKPQRTQVYQYLVHNGSFQYSVISYQLSVISKSKKNSGTRMTRIKNE